MAVIWNSIWLMTIFDLLILGVVGYAFMSFYQQRAVLTGWRMDSGFLAIGFGLSVLALLYLADLLTMHAFPLVMSASQGMATMERLHLDASWIIALIGLGAISLGLKYANHSVFSLVDSLNASQTRLLCELSLRRESEVALRESESRLANAASIAMLGYWIWDEIEDKAVYCSDELAEIYGVATGRELTAMLSSSDKDLEWIHQADRERVGELMRERKTEKRRYDIEFRILRSDGKVRHLYEILEPVLDGQGNLVRSNGVIQDITEHKQAEAALLRSEVLFRAFIDNLPVEVVIRDTEGRFLLVNRTWEKATGRSGADAIGRTTHDVFPKQEADLYMALDRAVLATGRAVDEEVEVPREGDAEFLHMIKFPIPDARGNITGIGAITTDITERKRAEEQLRQSEKLKAVGQLTGGIAHDFNNLLAVISLSAGYLEDDLEDGSDAAGALNAMRRAAKRGAELTHRLLAFSRQHGLQSEITDVNALVIGMIDMLRRTLRETIEIETALSDDLWRTRIDSHQLENALLNLAINARDAMPRGGKLTIETANIGLYKDHAAAQDAVAPGAYVRLSVSDSGSGMAPEVIAHVFEPFFTTKDVGEGTGLGLSMIYGFVKQSGGHIAITSEVGHGTTANLYLPVTDEIAETVGPAPATEEPQANGETVLVVEDDEDVRRVVAKVLSHLGYQVLEAGDGEQALAALAQASGVDLLLSDVVLPGGTSGPEIATEFRRHRPGLKSLFMSGCASAGASHKGRLPEDAALLPKPFTRLDLAQKVRAALDG